MAAINSTHRVHHHLLDGAPFALGTTMTNTITPDLDDRFFEGIVQGHTHLYDAIEIQPVSDLLQDGSDQRYVEPDYENPTFFSVYVHLKGGGVECVGDHGRHSRALAYAMELSTEHGWPIKDYVPRKFYDSESPVEPALQP